MKQRCIVTYASGAHEELLDVALPTYKEFAHRHNYDLVVGDKKTDRPAPWNKILIIKEALKHYIEVVWFDCDLVVVDNAEDFPEMPSWAEHSLVRHFERCSEIPNSGVWRTRCGILPLLNMMWQLEVFDKHGWWEQAALMTYMGYTVPPQGSRFDKFRCKCVKQTEWYRNCCFMRLCWNSHPNYRAERPRIVHCSYPDMGRRLDVMRELVKNPAYDYPKYDVLCPKCSSKDEVDE